MMTYAQGLKQCQNL